MTTALKISIKFGISVSKAEELCAYLEYDLEDEIFDRDPDFERVARSIKRGRPSAYALAWIVREATQAQEAFLLNLSDDFRTSYETLDITGREEPLKGAELMLKRMEAGVETVSDWETLASWMKEVIKDVKQPVKHNYLAVRLLLSLPEKRMGDYSKSVAQAFNKIRHRGRLNGWHLTVSENGTNIVLYQQGITLAKRELINLDISDQDIEKAEAVLGTQDIVKLAGYLSYLKKIEFEKILTFLEQKTLDL